MPKSTKAKKSKSSYSSSALSNFINLSTTKGRLILFVLVFGVIGGGVFLYSSFAAANPRVHYTSQITGSAGAVKVVDAYASYVSNGGKGNGKVWDLPIANSTATTKYVISKHNQEVDFSPCVYVKRPVSAGAAATIEIGLSKNNFSGGVGTQTVQPSDEYQTVCDSGTAPYIKGEKGTLTVSVTNKTGSELYVQSITVYPSYVSYTSN